MSYAPTGIGERKISVHGPRYTGMALREYYAGLALQGLIAFQGDMSPGRIVEVSVQYADELIKELNK